MFGPTLFAPTLFAGGDRASRVFFRCLVCLGLASVVLACSQEERSTAGESAPKPADRPDVVLLVFDTFRPDYLGMRGYERVTAPFVEDLATRSTVFERATSTSSWTPPSVSSLFTGLYPTRHGVTEGFRVHQRRAEALEELVGTRIRLNRLPEDVRTLPEILRDAGYRTFGLASNINIGPEIGFDRGFDHFEKLTRRTAERLAEMLEGWRAEIEAADPSFVYLHFDDVHAPYHRREPWYEPREDPVANLASAYASEISYLDGVVADLYRDFGWDEDTLLVIVSDHGEEFGDHGQVGHNFHLYDELTQVLFLVHGPDLGIPARSVETRVSLVDVKPTILDLLDLPRPPDRDGRSLAPFLETGEKRLEAIERFEERVLFAHRARFAEPTDTKREHLWMATRGPWKLVERPDGIRLHNVEEDPAETVDLSDREPEIFAALRRELEAFRAESVRRTGPGTSVEVDAETLEALRALGYVE